jgi:GT2 family glycosyltransferase
MMRSWLSTGHGNMERLGKWFSMGLGNRSAAFLFRVLRGNAAIPPWRVPPFLRRQGARLASISGFCAHSTDNFAAIANIVSERNRVTGVKVLMDPLSAPRPGFLPDVDICIVSYNDGHWLAEFATSLIALDYPKAHITVRFVDNSSTDGTAGILEKEITRLKDVGFKVDLQRRPNLGFGAGHNAAIKGGFAPFCLVTNVDLVFEPTALAKVVAVAVADRAMTAAWELRQKPFEHPKYYDPVTGITNWNSHACVLLRRSAFEEVGGYDETLFLYGEDVELSYRFRRAGYALMYCPAAEVQHFSYKNTEGYKPKQLSGSAFANLYLRLIYGTWTDVAAVVPLGLRALVSRERFPGARREAIANLARILAATPKALRQRKRSAARFPFRNLDYELTREGSFVAVEPRPAPTPLVSVITRTYSGREKLLKQALLSVAHQSYPAIEMIVVEDGGQSQRELVQQLAAVTDADVRFIGLGKIGRSAAGNAGLAAANGRYCLFLDDDDLLFADHVEVLVQALRRAPDAVAAYSLAWEVVTKFATDGDYTEIYHKVPDASRQLFDPKVLEDHNFMPIQAVLFDRALFNERGGFDEDLNILEDWILWQCYGHGNRFEYVEKVTSMFRTPFQWRTRRLREQRMLACYPQARERAKKRALELGDPHGFHKVNSRA